jgi:transcriptional regulator GlxA family with amidase domain
MAERECIMISLSATELPGQAPIAEILARAQAALARGHSDQRASLLEVCAVLERMGKHDAEDGPPSFAKGGLAAWQLNRVVQHIESQIHEPLNVCDLAAIARLSTRHFTRAFQRSAGLSPRAYIIGRRIVHAKMLMLTTEMPLCEIALACGTCDQAHFSRLFKAACGMPPLQWRRRQAPPVDPHLSAQLRSEWRS